MDEEINSEDFPALWSSHQGMLLIYIMGAIPQFQDAQDVLQKVAVIAFRKQATFDPECMEFAAWVRAIARFAIMHYRRSHARDKLVFDENTLEKIATIQDSLGSELDERFALLRTCLEAMQGRAKEVVELRYREELMPSQIAERLHTSVGAISVALNKARHALRSCVERQLNLTGG